jgi:hypothetical protein
MWASAHMVPTDDHRLGVDMSSETDALIDFGGCPKVPMRVVCMPRRTPAEPPHDMFHLLLRPLKHIMNKYTKNPWRQVSKCDGVRPEHVLLGPWGKSLSRSFCGSQGIDMCTMVANGLTWEHVALSGKRPHWFAETLHATRQDLNAMLGDVAAVDWTREEVLYDVRE